MAGPLGRARLLLLLRSPQGWSCVRASVGMERRELLSLGLCLVAATPCAGCTSPSAHTRPASGQAQYAPRSWCSFFALDNIPEDLRDPFYIDQYEQEHIKPPVIKLLLSSELYCRVCSLILKGDQAATLQGHQSVIQALSRKGIYVMESDDTPVTDADLGHAPIKMVSVCGRHTLSSAAWRGAAPCKQACER